MLLFKVVLIGLVFLNTVFQIFLVLYRLWFDSQHGTGKPSLRPVFFALISGLVSIWLVANLNELSPVAVAEPLVLYIISQAVIYRVGFGLQLNRRPRTAS